MTIVWDVLGTVAFFGAILGWDYARHRRGTRDTQPTADYFGVDARM